MKIKHTLILAAGLLVFNLTNVKAQAAGAAPSASALKAAEEMMVASGGSVQFEKSINAGIEQMSTNLPEDKRAKFLDAMKGFMAKYCSWTVLKDDLCLLYAREFTEPELRQLTAFYKSPVGLKMAQKLPLILQTSMALGQKAATDHQAELQQIMSEIAK